jgi:Rod binding domain-containing protein
MSGITSIANGRGAAHATQSAEKIKDAAAQFEGMLIAQMLRSVREAASTDDSDSAGGTMLELAEQHMAQLLAANGGLGVAKLVVKGLNKSS